MAISIGSRFDRYEVLSLLGKGGMGEVYLAQDTKLARKVALKLLPARFTEDEDSLRRFKQEAQAASALNHPNIITIYEVGQVDSTHFIATEFIEGTTLRKRLEAKRMNLRQSLDVAIQVAGALAAAHAAGIIHRDIKPENIMLRPDGYVKVLDFGLAKLAQKSSEFDQFREKPLATTGLESKTVGLDLDAAPDALKADPYATTPLATAIDQLDSDETQAGLVMGTLRYMSPEQARGLRVDARSDIFSLGVVIYEMITGIVPFEEATTRGMIAAILETDPLPLAHFAADVPEVLEWIVTKALMKDREERYQTAKELQTDLRRLKHQLDLEYRAARSQAYSSAGGVAYARPSGATVEPEPSDSGAKTVPAGTVNATSSAKYLISEITRHKKGSALILATILALIGVVSFGLYKLFGGSRARPAAPFQSMRMTRLTTMGKATRAAISPDGKYVVHVMSDAGKQSLRVGQVTTPNNVEVVAPADVIYRGLTFSRDGNYIYYVVQEQNNPIQVLYQVAVLGGAPRKLLVDIDSPVTVSPDNTQLAFVRRSRSQGEDSLVISSTDGLGERVVARRSGTEFFAVSGPAWSPDGRTIACGAGTNAGGRQMSVVEIDIATGKERPLSSQSWFDVGRVAWLAGGLGLVVSATEQGATLAQVWQIDYPGGRTQKITNDLNDYRDMSLTADSASLVTVQSEARVNIWTMPVGDTAKARPVTSGVGQYNGVRGISWASDGRIVYVSRVSGSQDIWIMEPDGSNQKQLTTAATRADVDPSVTPDGRFIIFASNRTGNSNIWRMELDGGNAAQLTKGAGEEFPYASPDGKWAVYTSTSSSRFTIWRVSTDGGQPTQLTDKLSQWPVVSPDGKMVACWYRDKPDSPWRIAVIPIEGGEPLHILNVPPTVASSIPARWTADGRSIAFIDTRDGVSNIWSLAIEGGPARQLTDFKDDQIFWFDFSRDGRQLAVSRGAVTNDVVLITEFK